MVNAGDRKYLHRKPPTVTPSVVDSAPQIRRRCVVEDQAQHATEEAQWLLSRVDPFVFAQLCGPRTGGSDECLARPRAIREHCFCQRLHSSMGRIVDTTSIIGEAFDSSPVTAPFLADLG
jgi:hypothetical protein